MADKKTDRNVIGKGKPGPGRPKGSLNRHTGLLKDAILKAAQEAGGGGEDGTVNYLTQQARENPSAFMALLGKVLPADITSGGDKIEFPAEIIIRAAGVSD